MRPSIYIIEPDLDRSAAVEAMLTSLGYDTLLASRFSQTEGLPRACAAWVGAIETCKELDRHLSKVCASAAQLPLIVPADSPVAGQFEEERRRCHRVAFPLRRAEVGGLLQRLTTVPKPNPERRLVGSSEAMQRVQGLVRQVARHDTSVLILGESGTGKEIVARTIHDCSPRRDKPFVAINCGAIPPDLLESELFGHEKGAFTGAISARKGRFELAEGGTLFLDEIGDMSLTMQVKLLRVLQERVFERVGGNRSMETDVRIVAATHRNLEDAIVNGGTFREDLYYRIAVFPIEMPSLRERIGDLGELVEEFTQRLQRRGVETAILGDEVIRTLSRHAWPGNVRELGNLVERLSVMYPGRSVRGENLPVRYRAAQSFDDMYSITAVPGEGGEPVVAQAATAPVGSPFRTPDLSSGTVDLKEHLAEIEIALIRQAMALTDNVVAQAAKILNLQRTTLVEKLRKYGLQASNGSLMAA